jgi:hypothetical protein
MQAVEKKKKKHAAVSKNLQVINQRSIFHIILTNPLNRGAQGSIRNRSCDRQHPHLSTKMLYAVT